MTDLFISYSREDQAVATQLYTTLREQGWSVWLDLHLNPGTAYRSQILQQLHQATVVIVLWSQYSVASQWVHDEAEEAIQYNKFIPVRIDGTAPPLGFRGYQTLSLEGWNGSTKSPLFQAFAKAIRDRLETPSPGSPPQPTAITHKSPARVTWVAAGLTCAVVLAAAYVLWTWWSSSVPGMVKIPAGPFLRGLTPEHVRTVQNQLRSTSQDLPTDWFRSAQPATQIQLNAFYIDTHEVTWGAFCAFLNSTQERVPSWVQKRMTSETYPAVGVTWLQAKAYCESQGKRLPTEAEWEKAARGMSGKLYPWGDQPPTPGLANFCDSCTGPGLPQTHQVAQLKAVGSFSADRSPYGIFDLAGSAREWVEDFYASDYYSGPDQQNPRNNQDADFRVVRGGSWRRDATFLPSARRDGEEPLRPVDDIGFRCARSSPPLQNAAR